MAVDTTGRRVGATGTDFAVNTGLVHLNRMIVESLVLGRDIQVLVAGPAGVTQIGRVDP